MRLTPKYITSKHYGKISVKLIKYKENQKFRFFNENIITKSRC